MTSLKLEPSRAIAMFKQSLAQAKDPVKDQALMLLTPEGVKVAFQLAADVAAFADYQKSYFKQIDVADDPTLFADYAKLDAQSTEEDRIAFITNHPNATQLIVATASFIKDRLKYGFKGDELTLKIDSTKIFAIGATSDETLDETRAEVTKELLEAKALYTTVPTDIGLGMTPSDEMATSGKPLYNIQALITPSYFADLPSFENVIIETDGRTITMNFSDQLGGRKRIIGGKDYPIKNYAVNNKPQPTPVQTEPLKATFNMKMLTQLASIYEGDVWLSINGGALVLSQKYPDYSLTYVLAATDTPS